MSSPAAPGWYPDGQGNTYYWNGQAWQDQPPVQPSGHPGGFLPPSTQVRYGPPQQQPKKHPVRNVILGILGLIVVIAVISSVASGNKKNDKSNNNPGSVTTSNEPTSPNVSKGIGANDASGDIKIGTLKSDPNTGNSVPVTVTNHSSKRSDYVITLALESSDGKTQIDTADIFVQNLEPGQSTSQTGDFLQTLSKPAPADSKVVLQTVERVASS